MLSHTERLPQAWRSPQKHWRGIASVQRFDRLVTLERGARIAIDLFVIQSCYLAALIAPILLGPHEPSARALLSETIDIYLTHCWLLALVGLASYSIIGLYSHGALYRGRLKPLAVLQAVTATYLLFGLILSIDLLNGLAGTPPDVIALAGGLTAVAAIAARLWARVWRVVVLREGSNRPETNRKGPIRRVLVIGGAGYIGSTLCRQLLAQGYSVRVLDALLYGKESIAPLLGNRRFELITGDSRDIGDVFSAMLGIDAVVHLGELVGDPACAIDEDLTLEINLAATRMVAEAARGYGVKRFVYASSCSVYGASDDLLDESSALNPVSLYARAKVGSERALLELDGEDFHPIVLRLATVFGLSCRPRFDLVVNVLAANAFQEGEITLSNGDQWRPFVHVTDVCRAMIRCLQAPLHSVKGQVFNVGSDDQNHTIRQIGEMVHDLVPASRLVSTGDDGDRRNYRVCFGKIQRQLRFACSTGLQEGILEILEALRLGQLRDYRVTAYSNHKTLVSPRGQVPLRGRHVPELYQNPQPRPAPPLRAAAQGGAH